MASTRATSQNAPVNPNPNPDPNPFRHGLGIQAITPPNNNLSSHFHDDDDDGEPQDQEEEEEASTIHLKINTPMFIKGDNNMVAVDPSIQASKIAMCVVQALKQLSAGANGVPMIDESGRPRPLLVEISAEITVDGAKNVVGEKPVLASVASAAAKQKALTEGRDIKEMRKRERSEDREGDSKRAKKEYGTSL